MRRPAIFLVTAIGAGAAWAPADARACSIALPQTHEVDPAMQATDQVPPELPPLDAPQITRGKAPYHSGCSYSTSSCDDIGSIVIPVAATDDQTPPEQLGFRLSLEEGMLPTGLSLPTEPVRSLDDVLVLNWIDGASSDQEPFDCTLRVVAIDLAGNESEPQTVRVTDDPGGCAIVQPRAPHRTLMFVAAAALVLALRRRPSRRLG